VCPFSPASQSTATLLTSPYKNINEGNVGLICKFGRYTRSVDPGIHRINPLSEDIKVVNTQQQVIEFTQDVFTKDNVFLTVTTVTFWTVNDPFISTFNVSDVNSALVQSIQSIVRIALGNTTRQDAIESKNNLEPYIFDKLKESAFKWGILIENVLIKDIVLDSGNKQDMQAVAIAKRDGEAKIINSSSEVDAAKEMRKAADTMSTCRHIPNKTN
jgi:regulator of protease activity HflC (stomatin/prohibitin superfamily)